MNGAESQRDAEGHVPGGAPEPVGATTAYFGSLGPWWTAATAALHLGISEDALHNLAKRNAALGVEFADGKLYYPRWQFDDDGVLRGVHQVLEELMPALRAPETCAAWFVGTVYEDGLLRRIDELRAGRVDEAVSQAVAFASRLLEH